MPNAITATGLTTATQSEYQTQLSTDLEDIYGSDIVLESSTPDGQWMNIIIQIALDLLDLLMQIYNGFDPDNAIGVVLDQRCAINGVIRQGGTFTITDVTLVITQSVNLYGLDQEDQDPYIVADNAGNNFILQETQLGLAPGTYALSFRAQDPGEVLTTPNTITTPVTVVLGVASVNNPTSYTSLGINEESDVELKIRRQKSVALPSSGYYEGLVAALENIPGITSVLIYENDTDSTDGDGIPGHSIWVIVGGTADDADIAQAIYVKRSAGCGMKGSETFTITRPSGAPFVVRWDVVENEDLFIEFDATSLDGVNPPQTTIIKDYLAANYKPGVFGEVNINQLATLVQIADPNTLVTNAGFADNGAGPFTNTLVPSAKNKQFAIDAANIDITVI